MRSAVEYGTYTSIVTCGESKTSHVPHSTERFKCLESIDYNRREAMVNVNDNIGHVTNPTKAIGKVTGPPQPTGTQLWGHTIIFTDESVECKRCNEEFEVPEVFRASRALHEAVYRMYIFGKMKHMDCGIDYEGMFEDGDTITTDQVRDLYGPNSDVPNKRHIYWADGSRFDSSDNEEKRLRERYKV